MLFTFLQPRVLLWKEKKKKKSCALTGNYSLLQCGESWMNLAAAGTLQRPVESMLSECIGLIWICPKFIFLTGFNIL